MISPWCSLKGLIVSPASCLLASATTSITAFVITMSCLCASPVIHPPSPPSKDYTMVHFPVELHQQMISSWFLPQLLWILDSFSHTNLDSMLNYSPRSKLDLEPNLKVGSISLFSKTWIHYPNLHVITIYTCNNNLDKAQILILPRLRLFFFLHRSILPPPLVDCLVHISSSVNLDYLLIMAY
jgi:hypothetical protein